MFFDVQFAKGREALPKLFVVENEPAVITRTTSSHSEQQYFNSSDFCLPPVEKNLVEEDRWGIKLVPGEQALQVGLGNEIAQVLI